MTLQGATARIEVKLTSSGRYVWSISIEDDKALAEGVVKDLRRIDRLLREEFPNHATTGSGRVASFEEE